MHSDISSARIRTTSWPVRRRRVLGGRGPPRRGSISGVPRARRRAAGVPSRGSAFTLPPELALALFVAPFCSMPALRRVAAGSQGQLGTSQRPGDLRGRVHHRCRGLVVRALVPDMPWAPAIALGAVVAPPDAVAATAVLRQLRPPHRILTILEGESLLNDASALLIYRLAVGAVAANGFSVADGRADLPPLRCWQRYRRSRAWMADPAADGSRPARADRHLLQFVTTFGVWLLAEQLGFSGVLTVVCFAVGWRGRRRRELRRGCGSRRTPCGRRWSSR